MKNKYHNEFTIFKYLVSTDRYKAIFGITLIFALYGSVALGVPTDDFCSSVLVPFQFYIFNIFLFVLFFLNQLNVCSTFQKEFSSYIIRLKTKREYIKTLLRLSALAHLYQILILFLLMMVIFWLTTFHQLSIEPYMNYSISNIVYVIFYMVRYTIFSLMIILISTLGFVWLKDKILIVLQAGFLALLFIGSYSDATIHEHISLSIWNYFQGISYSSFSLEVTSSIAMLLVLEIILLVFYSFCIKSKRVVIA